MRDINVNDIIAGKVRLNEILKYNFERKYNVDIINDTHGMYYIKDNKKVYLTYTELKASLKGLYIRVSENKWWKYDESN